MTRKRNVAADRRRRRMITILWTAVLAIVTIILIYKEMTALLYILATLGVTALLLVVAMADLAHAERLTNDPRGSGDSAAIGSGITSTMGNN
jgi:heme O synthase-like polyprenyltransferase